MTVTCVRSFLRNDPHQLVWLLCGGGQMLLGTPDLDLEQMQMLWEEHYGAIERVIRKKGVLPPAAALLQAV